MKSIRVQRLCQTAVFAAIIYVFTAYLHVPSFNGYTHVGDGFLYLAASTLPVGYAAAAGAIGFAVGAGAMLMPGNQKLKKQAQKQLDKLVRMAKMW